MERNICFICALSSSSASRCHFCCCDGRARARLKRSVLLCTAHPAVPGPSPTLSLPSGMPSPLLLHLPSPASSPKPSAPRGLSFPVTASVSATLLCHSASASPTALLCRAAPGESPAWSSQRTCQNEARVRSKVKLEPKSPSSLLYSPGLTWSVSRFLHLPVEMTSPVHQHGLRFVLDSIHFCVVGVMW